MRGILAAIALACAAFAGLTSAQAQQQAPPSDDGVVACVERAGASLFGLQKCKGAQAGPCTETDQGSTTAGSMMCWQAEGAAWRGLMEQAIERARTGASSARAQALAASQDRWLAWRAAECQYQALIYEGGSLARVIGAYCVADLTADRAIAFIHAERNADH